MLVMGYRVPGFYGGGGGGGGVEGQMCSLVAAGLR